MKIYWNYFKYLIKHKWFVAVECIRMGMPIHALTHDLSKFRPSEFFPYADKFFSGDYAYRYFEVENAFEYAWFLHQRRNKHHWDYWVNSSGMPMPMPHKYVAQMVADWEAMGKTRGLPAAAFYTENKNRIKLHSETKEILRTFFIGAI